MGVALLFTKMATVTRTEPNVAEVDPKPIRSREQSMT
jgi:hypothetical protein